MSPESETSHEHHVRSAAGPAASILFLSHDPATAGHVYRVGNPVAALGSRGWQARWLPSTDPELAAAAHAADLVVAFRCPLSPALEAVITGCRHRGKPFVYDVDDLLFDPDLMASGAVAYLDTLPEAERQQWVAVAADHRRMLMEADAVVCTTTPLAAAASRSCPKTHVVPNVHAPAMLERAAVVRRREKPSQADGRPRLGFASGTPTHQRDFRVAAAAIARILARRPEPMLTVVGVLDLADFPELAPHASRIEVRPRVAFDDVAGEMARFDVNLAPLELGNPFCEAKSPIRCTLASAVGVPTVASPTQPLREAIIDGETGLLAATTADWEQAIERLLDDPGLRNRMGEAAFERVAAPAWWTAWCDRVHAVYSAISAAHGLGSSIAPPPPRAP